MKVAVCFLLCSSLAVAAEFTQDSHLWKPLTGQEAVGASTSSECPFEVIAGKDGYLYYLYNQSTLTRVSASIPELVALSPLVLEELDSLVFGHKAIRVFKVNPLDGSQLLFPDESAFAVTRSHVEYTLMGVHPVTQTSLWNVTYSELVQLPSVPQSRLFTESQHSFVYSVACSVAYYISSVLFGFCIIATLHAWLKRNSKSQDNIKGLSQCSPIILNQRAQSEFELVGISLDLGDTSEFTDGQNRTSLVHQFERRSHSGKFRRCTDFLAVPKEEGNSIHEARSTNFLSADSQEAAAESTEEDVLEEFLNDGNYARQLTFIKKLGRGGFGSVDLAEHKLDGQLYAIKKVRVKIAAGQQVNSHAFLKEVRALNRLQSKYVVRYNTSWVERERELLDPSSSEEWSEVSSMLEENGQGAVLHIQMEYCEGITLAQWLSERSSVDEAVNLHIATQLLKGVKHIHQSGILHRDLKPANIFIDSQCRIKIGDFNLATVLLKDCEKSIEFNRLSVNVGTPMYIAPEQQTTDSYSFKADMFSVGVILLELFALFSTQHEQVQMLKKLRWEHLLPASLEAAYPGPSQMIRWLTHPEPEHRPTAAELLHSDLFREWQAALE